jgi:peptidyl-prolyl cis-trans isomerase C
MFRALPIIAAAALTASAYAQTAAPAPAPAPAAATAKAAAPAAPAKAAVAPAAANGNVAVVNGKAIKISELETVLRQIKQPDSPELRANIREKLIDFELLTQEAKKRKLTEREDVKFNVDQAARQVLINMLIRDELDQHKLTDDQIKAEYDRQRTLAGEKEYKAHHILVETEAQAKEIIAKLDKGEKFEDLAKGTKDAGSAARGGELDWSLPAAYVKPFSDAMVQLEKGKYTATPVQSQFGWHVIRLDDVRALQPPPLEQVRQQIVDAIQHKQITEFVESLHKKATIK